MEEKRGVLIISEEEASRFLYSMWLSIKDFDGIPCLIAEKELEGVKILSKCDDIGLVIMHSDKMDWYPEIKKVRPNVKVLFTIADTSQEKDIYQLIEQGKKENPDIALQVDFILRPGLDRKTLSRKVNLLLA